MAIVFSITGDEMQDLINRYFARYGVRFKAVSIGSGYVLDDDAPEGAAMEMRTWLEDDKAELRRMKRAGNPQLLTA